MTLIYNIIDIKYLLRSQPHGICTTSYNMTFFDLNYDVKSIITKHLLRDYKISTVFMSKHQDLQKNNIW